MGTFNKCCCCNLGSVIPKWQNVTKVRPAGDTLGPNYTAAPFPRLDETNPACGSDPAGTCGPWMFAGDENGVTSQGITDGVNDVGTCAPTDSTHVTTDHNCYFNDGSTTVDMRLTKLFGAQWVLAQKQWHGTFGWLSNDALPSPDPNVAADQTKYLTCTTVATASISASAPGVASSSSTVSTDVTMTVGQYTGILTQSGSTSETDVILGETNVIPCSGNVFTPSIQGDVHGLNDANAMQCGIDGLSINLDDWFAGIIAHNYVEVIHTVSCTSPVKTTAGWTFSDSGSATSGDFTYTWDVSCTVTRTDTEYSWTYSNSASTSSGASVLCTSTGTITLSDPYTAAECYADFLAALAAWDMSDMNLAHLRQDELLADAPLIVYDEVGATSPLIFNCPMNDYSETQNEDGSWPQRAWLDPNNYVWQYPNGSYLQPDGFTGGATLITPLRTGAIVAHTQAGSDPHFWFNYEDLVRTYYEDGGYYQWVISTHGGFSDGTIPQVSMRWQTGLAAQYDPDTPVVTPTPGNFPQMFWNQYGGQITGGKYVQAAQSWPAVNYGRPCGPDKYAVDQTTVCCVTGGDSTDGYTVVATFAANPPLGTGGLAVGDYIMVGGDGLYQISSITDDGPGGGGEQYTVMVGAILDTIPSGVDIGAGYLGVLRFPTASGICGRAAISTTYDSGTVTITAAVAQPYLRAGVTGGISVDIYDGSMTLLASAVALTRVDDSTFTVVHATMPTAAYLTGAGVNWAHDNSTSQRTGVHLEWTFDARGTQSGVTSPPTWYGDIAGCLSCSVAQFNYDSGPCPAVVGIVPFTDGSPTVESFANQTLFDFPSGTVVFDDIFGNHGQAAVMLTMPDPFWQTPFWPLCGTDQTIDWSEDDGTSEANTETVQYYAHHPLVEAAANIPSGESLPSGITLTYDSSHVIAPPFYPNGFPVVNDDGSFGSYATDWGFALNVCANLAGRFAGDYTFVSC